MNANDGRDILIADDQPMNLSVLSGMLRERGYRVRAVTNGRKAVEAARAQLPDLIMLDITMPEMDGFEACQALKADAALAGVPVIFISAHGESLDKVKAFAVGGADYVQKPFQVEEVLARIENQLRITSLQQELLAHNAALADANLKLQELDLLKARFAAMLVHDLKNPFSSALLSIEDMQETGALVPELLEKCRDSIQRALAFLTDLMEVYRSEAQGIVLERESVDPAILLASAVEAFKGLAARKGVAFQTSLDPGLPAISGDLGKLDRVLGNLLSNALKFTPKGGTILLRAEGIEGQGVEAGTRWLHLAVEDTGRGIPASQLAYIFDPYHQALSQDATQGSGLGLAIVARIVAAHEGRVTVKSREGIGTCFTVFLPVLG